MRLMSRTRQRCRRQIRDRGSVTSVAKRKGPPCRQHQVDRGISCPNLPEDILWHIHAQMPLPMCDTRAARAACVSHTFRQSWIRRPNLTFSPETLGLDGNASKDVIARDLISKIGHILQNRSGSGVKTLKLNLLKCGTVDSGYLDSWLRVAFTPGIEELDMMLHPHTRPEYNFPCSLLSNGSGNSIRYLKLCNCTLRPTVGFGSRRSLKRLNLFMVRITGDELGCLLSNSLALERLVVMYCSEVICLKIPSLLQRLSFLDVFECSRMQAVESNAPNLSIFYFDGSLGRISLGGSLQVKTLRMSCPYQTNIVCYARTNLLTIVPNVETLTIQSRDEMVNTPMLSGMFLHLKHLHISFLRTALSGAYDYFSLVSFLDASPCLENFMLAISQHHMEHASILGEPSHDLRKMPEHRHDKLKGVKITGFCSAKSLVELTCHILENTTSLDCLTLDTTDHVRCSVTKSGKCYPIMGSDDLIEAQKALSAIRRYIVGKVPSMVKLNVLEPCSRCHTVEP